MADMMLKSNQDYQSSGIIKGRDTEIARASRLQTIPVELILHILQYLPLQSLCKVQLLSKFWHHLFVANDFTIYHNAAVLHRFVTSGSVSLSDAIAAHVSSYLKDADDWRGFCRRRFQLEKNWIGRGHTTVRTYGTSNHDVHRIKVDESVGIVITTHEYGGLKVTDLGTDEVLWQLPSEYVRWYAHCEYDRGFLIFDRPGNYKEVWRLSTDYKQSERPSVSFPDAKQCEASAEAAEAFPSATKRGHFEPWALLEMPETNRAFRCVYPTLLAAGFSNAYLFDLRTATLIQTIGEIQGYHGGNLMLGNINYVDVNPKYVFICGLQELRVFSRSNGALVLRIPSARGHYAKTRVALEPDPCKRENKAPGDVVPRHACVIEGAEPQTSQAEFFAAHVSTSGRDLVGLLSDNRLILIRDFERVIKGEASISQAALEIDITVPENVQTGVDTQFSIYLAFEHGRVGAVTTSGIYIFSLEAIDHGISNTEVISPPKGLASISQHVSFPDVLISYLPCFHEKHALSRVTCLQMTETKLYLTWDESYMDRHMRPNPTNNNITSTAVPTIADQDVMMAGQVADVQNAEEDVQQHETLVGELDGGTDTTMHQVVLVDDPYEDDDEGEYEEDEYYDPSDIEDEIEAYGTEAYDADMWDSDDDFSEGDDFDAEAVGFPLHGPHIIRGPVVYCVDFSPICS